MNLIKRTLPWLAVLGTGALLAAGCELIASVDHDLIKEGVGGSTSSVAASDSSSTVTSATSSSTSTGSGCMGPGDCPVPPAECDQATCSGMVCGSEHKPAHTTGCTGGGGKVCDGTGACVGCVDGTDCVMGTEICSAANMCVPASCSDGMKDGDETDKDCGGSCGATCGNTLACGDFGDCLSGVCTGSVCVGCANDGECQTGNYCATPGAATGVCTPQIINGVACTANNQCAQNNCIPVTGGGQICCDTACAGGCNSCLASEKGTGQDGTCAVVATGTDPKMSCATTGTDCNTGTCDATGMCGFQPTSNPCGTGPMCAADSLKVQDTCTAAHMCPSGASNPCPNFFACADTTSCATSCSATGTAPTATSTGCKAGYFCDTIPGTPVCINTQKPANDPCNNNYECANGTCASNMCN